VHRWWSKRLHVCRAVPLPLLRPGWLAEGEAGSRRPSGPRRGEEHTLLLPPASSHGACKRRLTRHQLTQTHTRAQRPRPSHPKPEERKTEGGGRHHTASRAKGRKNLSDFRVALKLCPLVSWSEVGVSVAGQICPKQSSEREARQGKTGSDRESGEGGRTYAGCALCDASRVPARCDLSCLRGADPPWLPSSVGESALSFVLLSAAPGKQQRTQQQQQHTASMVRHCMQPRRVEPPESSSLYCAEKRNQQRVQREEAVAADQGKAERNGLEPVRSNPSTGHTR
jgi:hypothetical protein